MLFNVQSDAGDLVTAYLVPDSFSAVPRMRVIGGGEELARLDANDPIPALVAAGRHETGLCGFRIDTGVVPGLEAFADLELRDEQTDLLVYRRPSADFLPCKLLRLESGLLSLSQFDQSLAPRFQYSSRNIERLGHESTSQLFLLDSVNSAYLSGRILYKTYAHYIDNGFRVVMCVDEPHEALAERLLVLARLHQTQNLGMLGERDALVLKPAAEFAAQLPFTDRKALRAALRNLPADISVALVDPLTRVLTTSTPGEMPRSGALAWALDLLASFDVVGLRAHASEFGPAVAQLLGVTDDVPVVTHRHPSVVSFAQTLKEEAKVEHLIERDLELYQQLVAAVSAVSASA